MSKLKFTKYAYVSVQKSGIIFKNKQITNEFGTNYKGESKNANDTFAELCTCTCH